MKEQLRTEAEKFYKEYVKDKGQGAITLNVIDIMMAFHAQQSKQDITDEEIETLASNWFESFENTEKKGYTKYDVFKAGFITGQSQQSKERDSELIENAKTIVKWYMENTTPDNKNDYQTFHDLGMNFISPL